MQVSKASSIVSILSNNENVNSLQKSVNIVCVSSIPFNFSVSLASFHPSCCESIKGLHNIHSHPSKHVLQAILRVLPLYFINIQYLAFYDAFQLGVGAVRFFTKFFIIVRLQLF